MLISILIILIIAMKSVFTSVIRKLFKYLEDDRISSCARALACVCMRPPASVCVMARLPDQSPCALLSAGLFRNRCVMVVTQWVLT